MQTFACKLSRRVQVQTLTFLGESSLCTPRNLKLCARFILSLHQSHHPQTLYFNLYTHCSLVFASYTQARNLRQTWLKNSSTEQLILRTRDASCWKSINPMQ